MLHLYIGTDNSCGDNYEDGDKSGDSRRSWYNQAFAQDLPKVSYREYFRFCPDLNEKDQRPTPWRQGLSQG